MFKILRYAAATVALAALSSSAAFAQEITGAGATFPAPIYAKWAEAYQKATDRNSTRLNSSHPRLSRMPSSA